MTKCLEIPEGCEVITFVDHGIPRGARSTTRCCGQVVAETTGPAEVKATCAHCGRMWTVTRGPAKG